MTYATEFPGYPADSLPAIPAGWTDNSWHNDACPSFGAGVDLTVFIDYPDWSQREVQQPGPRFSVIKAEVDEPLLHTDDWDAVLALCLGEAFADGLANTLTHNDWCEMVALNQTPTYADGACASHNYCDANIVMLDAWHLMFDRPIDADIEAEAKLWNAAWEVARERHLGSAKKGG